MKESTEYSFELSRWQNRHFGHISMIKEKGFPFGILIEINCWEAEGNKSEFAINLRGEKAVDHIFYWIFFLFEYARAYIGSTRLFCACLLSFDSDAKAMRSSSVSTKYILLYTNQEYTYPIPHTHSRAFNNNNIGRGSTQCLLHRATMWWSWRYMHANVIPAAAEAATAAVASESIQQTKKESTKNVKTEFQWRKETTKTATKNSSVRERARARSFNERCRH